MMEAVPRPVANPKNRFTATEIDWNDPHLDVEPPLAKLEVHEEHAKSILSRNESPDLSFRWSVNPYRGCFHACAYCYARPSHQYWGFGAGSDFDRKLIAKVNAPELLAEAFDAPSWEGEWIVFSGNTDCYQPLEARYRLTRRLLEVCLRYRQPVGLITKSSLVRRDIDLLAELAKKARLKVTISAAMPDDETGRALEPGASPISRRFETMAELAKAGIEVGVSLAPVIPGVNDAELPSMLQRAKDHGASFAFMSLVRLSAEVLPVFDARLTEAMPLRAEKVRSGVKAMREGAMNDARFGRRMRGEGQRWKLVEQLFRMQAKKLGLVPGEEIVGDTATTFERPKRQLTLF